MPAQTRRRALIAIAIVLGMSALLAALAPEERRDGGAEEGTLPAEPAPREPAGETRTLSFDAASPRPRSVSAGSRVSLEVSVPAPGQVSVDGFGLNAPAEPGTPATFDVLAEEPGRYELRFAPLEGAEQSAGALVVEPVETG